MKKYLFLLLLISGNGFAQINLNLGLKAYYPFTGNANDASGNNNNPVFNNATLTADRFGNPNNAYHFDGTGNYMQIPNSATLNMGTQLSIAAWVKPMGFYAGTCHGNSVLMKGDNDFAPGSYLLRFDDNQYTNGANCSGPVNITHQNFYGFSATVPPPGYSPYIQQGQWYSVIITYDGTTAKLYVNCELKYSGAQGGISFSNAYDLFLGRLNDATYPYWFNGDLDEVRLYNRPLTLDEVDVLGGCPLTPPPVSGIINTYTPVLNLDQCNNKLTVEDGSTFNAGDTVLVIQMKGAVIDSSNTANFGTITDYKNAGNYEFNYVKSKAGNTIELKNALTRQYDIPNGKVQLVRVPYFNSVSVTATLSCLPWDGSKGGILVLNAKDTVILNADIDVSGNGFRGGNDPVTVPPVFNCNENQYYYPVNPDLASEKGEGIAIISADRSYGRGALANGGGGGNSHNSGGAGGGNITTGGFGGYQFEGSPCNGTVPFDNRGISGKALNYSAVVNKIFMGGGGGGGHSNNPEGFQANGGKGAGIIMIIANKIINNSNKIKANGLSGPSCGLTSSGCHEGMGGGGAAGTVLLKINTYLDNTTIETKGGKGIDMTAAGFGRLGPGGGGSGGAVWLTNATLPANVLVTNTGGATGVCTAYSNDPWGATAGQNGQNLFNLSVPVDNIPFRKNIDSVRIKDSLTTCLHYDFKGLGYTNTSPIALWQWSFGDGGTAAVQNTSHIYATPGTYNVILVVTDVNGCRDTVVKPIIVSSCNTSIVINSYTPVLAFSICDNKLTVEDGTAFNTGDTVLMIQMKGAIIDSSNTAAFGTVTDYKNAGNYEFNYVKSRSGNIIELKNKLTRQYNIPIGRVQLVRVPYFNSLSVTSTLTCPPWDGSKGGVLVLNVRDTVDLNADINVSGKGFLKGTMHNANINTYTCDITNFYYPDNTIDAAGKGEGISYLSSNRNSGKGPAANGGGGGLNTNSGGGGGSNGSAGGRGGYEWNNCPNYLSAQNWGYPGNSLQYTNSNNKIFMGGGGGAGHCNNQFDDPTVNADYNGGNGGGIVIVNTNYLRNNNFRIISKGDSAYQPNFSATYVTHDGMGGGGAGGTVLINSNNYINNIVVDVSGGKGADMVASTLPGFVGPGGGGGGGMVWVKQNSLPANLLISNGGGANGVIAQASNNPYGATPGLAGINVFSLVLPVSSVPFTKNIDSVRIKDSALSCVQFDFKGLGYTNTSAIAAWQWFFGDGGTANTQNTTHSYASPGTYTVKLLVTDINGCKDSLSKAVTSIPFVADAGNDTTLCTAPSVSVVLHASAGASYSWTPAIYLNNPNIQNPTATISSTTKFYVTITNSFGCSAMDSVTVTLASSLTPTVIITAGATKICKGTPVTFTAATVYGGATPVFQWKKNGVNVGTNSSSYTDAALNDGDTVKCVLISSISCALPNTVESNLIIMSVGTAPANIRYPTLSVLAAQPLQLQARNIGNNYNWIPVTSLNNHLIINPVFSGNQDIEYKIFITTPFNCQVVDTQLVKISGRIGIYVPRGFSPNGDANNDRLYPILVGIKQLNYFKIYNRWGNLIFETNSSNPASGWDGKFKGFLQPVETYTWVVEGIDVNGVIIKKSGNTLLIR